MQPPPPTHQRLLRHLVRPVRGGAGAVIVVFAVLLYFAAEARFIGIPLALLLTSWFFKYAYILFDHTARGFDEPPTLDIQMMNPVDEQRPLGQVVILGLIYAAVKLAESYLGAAAAVTIAIVAALLAPASAAVLGLEGNLIKAANPLEWIRVVRGLGVLYGAVLLVIVAYALGLTLLAHLELWLPLQIAIAMFAWLSVFSFLGGALYERRHELGIEAWASPERVEERQREQEMKDAERIVTEAYGLMRVDSHIKSWQLLKEWLSSRGNAPEDYQWLCERVSRLGRSSLHNPPDRGARRSAAHPEAHRRRPGCRGAALGRRSELSAQNRRGHLSLAQMAVGGGGAPRVARTLLTDFATRFAGDPCVPAAEALARHLGSTAP